MTTCEKEIEKYVKSASDNKSKLHVIVSTYHSSKRVYSKTGVRCMTANDEAHNCSTYLCVCVCVIDQRRKKR